MIVYKPVFSVKKIVTCLEKLLGTPKGLGLRTTELRCRIGAIKVIYNIDMTQPLCFREQLQLCLSDAYPVPYALFRTGDIHW